MFFYCSNTTLVTIQLYSSTTSIAALFKYNTCYCSTWLKFSWENLSLFKYNTCYCSTVICGACQAGTIEIQIQHLLLFNLKPDFLRRTIPFIQIQHLLLFNDIKAVKKDMRSPSFKYNTCYCSTQSRCRQDPVLMPIQIQHLLLFNPRK